MKLNLTLKEDIVIRGYGYNATAEMEIQVVPRITKSDTEIETEPGNHLVI